MRKDAVEAGGLVFVSNHLVAAAKLYKDAVGHFHAPKECNRFGDGFARVMRSSSSSNL